ncbi:MAG: hypothetical protein K2J01_00940 [Clostridiales bacterium]|nr:hypothetical protein [Clostridiales bacterium]
MKLTKFFKTIVISVCLAVSFVTAGLAMVGCGGGNNPEDKNDKTEEIKQAASAAVDFLNAAKENGGNYYSTSEYSDGSVYKYYTADGKMKIEYNGELFYGVKVGNSLYKISQADDMTWHKTNDFSELGDPVARTDNLINSINKTSKLSLWTDYDSDTKTLTATYSDETVTVKLDAGVLVITFNWVTGTTKHTIQNVGDVAITLPENIIDDTEY